MAWMEECWIVLDVNGDVIAEAETHQDAVGWALDEGYSPVADEIDDPGTSAEVEPFGEPLGLAANPGRTRPPTVELAHGAINNLYVDADDVMGMELKEAYEVVYPYYPHIRSAGASPLVLQESVSKLTASFLGTNFKTAKVVNRGRPARIKGLSLSPALRWLENVRLLREKGKVRVGKEVEPPPDKKWLRRFVELTNDLRLPAVGEQGPYDHCVGASNYCRRCCLTGTGHGTTPHNVIKKVVLSTLLQQHPVEFMRLLYEAIYRHAQYTKSKGKEPMVRLNVFSDLPWEAMAPWLLDPASYHGARVQFYDYTKLIGRGPQAGEFNSYDITFSFAGDNQLDVWNELQHGTRIAVVFAGNAMPKVGKRILWPDPRSSSNEVGVQLKVVDGLADDARPRDPPRREGDEPVVVALKYKVPAGKPSVNAFIVRAWKHPEGYYLCDAHMPAQTNLEGSEED